MKPIVVLILSFFFNPIFSNAQTCPDTLLNLYPSAKDICYDDLAKIVIEGSEIGVVYKAVINTTIVSDEVTGGNKIELTLQNKFLNPGKNKIRIVASKIGCQDVLLKLSAEILMYTTTKTSKFFIEFDKYVCAAAAVKIVGRNVDSLVVLNVDSLMGHDSLTGYYLFVNGVQQKKSLKKEGDYWLLSALYGQQNLRVEERFYNKCGLGRVIILDTIFVVSPRAGSVVKCKRPCYGEKGVVEVPDSEPGCKYFVEEYAVQILSDTLSGNGGTLTFFLKDRLYKPLLDLYVNVYSSKNPKCIDLLYRGDHVIDVYKNNADFNISSSGGYSGDVFTITNKSQADSFRWNINGTTSTTFNPAPVTFTTLGIKDVTLVAHTNLTGCYDTLRKSIEIVNPSPQPAGIVCDYTALSAIKDANYVNSKSALSFHVDRQGNRYVAERVWFNGVNGFGGTYGLSLKKYNSSNQLLWEKKHDIVNGSLGSDFNSNFITGMQSDGSGNLYVTGHFGGNLFEWDNMKLMYDSLKSIGYLLKLDADGKVQWAMHNDSRSEPNFYEMCAFTDIIYVNDSTIYASIANPRALHFPDGTSEMLDSIDLGILHINSEGKLIKKFTTVPSTFPPSLIFQSNLENYYTSSSLRFNLVSPKMALTSSGKLIVGGKSNGMIRFDALTYPAKKEEATQFIAVLDPEKGWENVFNAYSFNWFTIYFHALEKPYSIEPLFTLDKDDNIYVTDYFEHAALNNTVKINGDSTILTGPSGGFTAKFNLEGKLQWFDHTPLMIESGILSIKNEVLVYGTFRDFYSTGAKNTNRFGAQSKGSNDIVLTSYATDGKINWIQTIGNDTSDFSYLMTKDSCAESAYILGGVNKSTSFLNKNLTVNDYHTFIGKYAPERNCFCNTNEVAENKESSIIIYPNPASEKLRVKSERPISKISVKNILGKEVNTTVLSGDHFNQQIDVSSLPPATYFICVTVNGSELNEKFLIVR